MSKIHMSIASTHRSILASLILLLVSTANSVGADDPGATIWVHPLIKQYGGVHPRPDLAGLPAGLEYKLIIDVLHGSADHAQAGASLQRLARLANLFAYAGVPAAHVHIAAVIEGDAAWGAFSNEAYRKRFKVDNPNLELLRELKRSGVELMVCAQGLAENDFPDSDVTPEAKITLSALSDFAVYEAQGYSYLAL